MAETIGDFFDRVTDGAAPAFHDQPWYNAAGDCIHYHWRADAFYGSWIDDKLTVYRSLEKDEAVGCQIKGVRALLQKIGDFGISLNQTDGMPLAIFLFVSQNEASATQTDPASREQTYKYLLEQVGKQKVEVEAEPVSI